MAFLKAIGDTFSSLIKSGTAGTSRDGSASDSDCHFDYETVVGYFLQDASTTSPGTFNAMKENFGLINQDYDTDTSLPANGRDLTQWQRFAHKLKVMNIKAPKDVTYRLLYLGRHGQGYHNVGQMYYGDDAWDCYYSTLYKDPTVPSIVFFDAHLTPLGEHQARTASKFWQDLIKTRHIPVPQTYYCSPHTRAIQTARLTFASLSLSSTARFDPLIKENLREGHGIHTCDSRPTKSYIRSNFPTFRIEESFTETDELYSPDLREPPCAHSARMRRLLDDVFDHDDSTYISMTSHSGTIAATLSAIGHRAFFLPTGGAIPVLVKATRRQGPRPGDGDDDTRESWDTKPECKNDPLKAGKEGYKDIGEYLEEINKSVPISDAKDPIRA